MSAIVQFFEERFSRLKEVMDPFHLGIFVKIAESVPFIRNCIVIEQGLQPYALDIKDPAEKLQNMSGILVVTVSKIAATTANHARNRILKNRTIPGLVIVHSTTGSWNHVAPGVVNSTAIAARMKGSTTKER